MECTSPWTVQFLDEGPHTAYVRARDRHSLYDQTPANQSWTVVAPSDPAHVFSDGFESGNLNPWSNP